MTQKLNKFKLLMWKNWKLQLRHKKQSAIEILAPVVLAALLVLTRSQVDPKKQDAKHYVPFSNTLDLNKFENISHIAWSPYNKNLNAIMDRTATILGIQARSFKDSEAMTIFLQDQLSASSVLAGIQFDDSLGKTEVIPEDLEVRLRFPSELRIDPDIQRTWKTNKLFAILQFPGPREKDENEGYDPGYWQEGFLALQQELSYSIIKHFNKDFERTSVPIQMQRFAYPAWTDDPMLIAIQGFAPLIIICCFLYSSTSIVKSITAEKEKQLKESMKIMGLPNWLHWTAWFIQIYTFLIISALLIVMLLTVSWYPGTDFSVFTVSNGILIFLLFCVNLCATVTFAFFISVFFSKANTAATIAGLVYFLSFFPYLFTQSKYETQSLYQKLAICLCSNSAMAYAVQLIVMFEGAEVGLQWRNVFKTVTPDDNLTVGYVIIMLIIDAVLYLLLTLYIEAVFPGEYGIAKKWNFPFTLSYWQSKPQITDLRESVDTKPASTFFENEPTNLQKGIAIQHLQKVYNKDKLAVNDLSLNMYQDQITVLLGHNGAGKTTTMSMLTGMFPPSRGTAIVGGFDIITNIEHVRSSLGLCPQHNVLFDDLTVREHLYFFSKLKGLDEKETKNEIDKYLEMLDLVPKADNFSSTLSGGMKRKLSVGVALCGGSKVVMLDEPTAGMDPAARRALWDLLKLQKKGRTILLTTHYMDEADLLGDRIAIMAGGKLQCCGSSFFLKKRYGAGYHLVMEKTPYCDVKEVTNLLRKYIPKIQVEGNIGSELTYVLLEEQAHMFQTMLEDLESNSQKLGISTYGISLTTLEEVFMKVGADHVQNEKNTPDHSETNGKQEGEELSTAVEMREPDLLTGSSLCKNQFLAMLMKKCLSSIRSWFTLLMQFVLPIIFVILTIIFIRSTDEYNNLPGLEIKLDDYMDPITVITGTTNNIYYNNYIDLLKQLNKELTDWKDKDMSEEFIKQTEENTAKSRMRYVTGATFGVGNSVTAWFNNQPYHAAPLTLGLVMNSILQHEASPRHMIHIYNHPMPYTESTKIELLNQRNNVGFQLAFNIGFAMIFASSLYIIFCVRERVSKAKHLQFVSGVEVATFWGTSFLCDFVIYLLAAICIIIALVIFQEDGFKTSSELGRMFAVLLFFGISILPLVYLLSFLFDVPSSAYSRMTMIGFFSGIATYLTVQILSIEGLGLKHIADGLHLAFLFIPYYSLTSGIADLYGKYTLNKICTHIVDVCLQASNMTTTEICRELTCQMQKQCCNPDEDYFAWDEGGIGKNLVFSVITALTSLVLLLLMEYRVFEDLRYKIQCKRRTVAQSSDDAMEDSDVMAEKAKIQNATQLAINNYSLVLRDVSKNYKNFLAVNGISLGINRYECFGLLGVNGAGKTTTFKMMTGDERITQGDAWVNGINLKKHMKKVYKSIGYCPQFDALLDDLTARETLIIFGLLRGIPRQDCADVAKNIAKDFDFHAHLDKRVKQLSGGNKRKLSTALALVGNPLILYLDEPTAGMDPATKRYLWNALCKIRDNGKCIVLTSHSMEECEALCTRLAIMVNGTFKCLGSTQHLKSKFSEGYTLTIKVRKPKENEALNESELQELDVFVKEKFPSAKLQEKHEELLTYYIQHSTLPWSKMFGIMESGKKIHHIEDYYLGQSSLEQVFLTFTKHQWTEDTAATAIANK